MYHYKAYGLSIESSLSLPVLIASSAGTDVVIHSTHISKKPLPPLTLQATWNASPREVSVTYPHVGTFLVRDGCEIQVELEPSASEDDAHPLIVGPLLGILLHQRGLITLHGSCVGIDGSAISFMAPSTGGKSTIASVFCARGYDLLADDITALDAISADAWVRSAYPQLKLWPDAVEYLGQQPASLPRVHPSEDKRLYDTSNQFARTNCALKQIYVLAEGDDCRLDRLTPREAMMELLGNSYCADLPGYVSAPAYFQKCAALAKIMPVYRLTRPLDLHRLNEVATMVERNLTAEVTAKDVAHD